MTTSVEQEAPAPAESPRVQRRERLSAKYAEYANPVMILVSLGFLIGFLATRLPNQSSQFLRNCYIAMAVLWVVFVIDFAIRVLFAPHRLKYIALHPFTVASIFFPPLRALIGLRALFLIIGGGAQRERTAAAAEIAGWLVLLAVSFGSIAVVHFEAVNPKAQIKTLGTGIWWSFETISTVGYGDYTPITLGGRVVAVLLMFVGVGLISIVSATLASGLIRVGQRDRSKRAAKQAAAKAKAGTLKALVQDAAADDFPREPTTEPASLDQARADANDAVADGSSDVGMQNVGDALSALIDSIESLKAEVADLKGQLRDKS